MVTLSAFFMENPKAAIAFSGGVDSAYLLYAAMKCGAEVKAYYVKTAFQPQFELDDAKRLAEELGADMEIIPCDILCEDEVTVNPADRCYYCKQKLFSLLTEKAKADGYTLVLDGTNASDDAGDRPGMRALRELSVRSPLRECGLTKAEIRKLSKEAGLFTWDKPAYACLATRIPTGEVITAEKLWKTEAAEGFLSGLGLRDFRVRMMGNTAKLQVPGYGLEIILNNREAIVAELKKYYDSVVLDLEMRGEQ
ncbi:MAG: ATP-dependent sacrificial sulfur transferase LarE [Lachnospiraceae bacterium]|nr:ATP-dependent sacrificial sulfur transferase LarE [Lachnospiraceae bacterium]